MKKKGKHYIKRSLKFLAKIPYYFTKGIYTLGTEEVENFEKEDSDKLKDEDDKLGFRIPKPKKKFSGKLIPAIHEDFEILYTSQGNYKDWEEKVNKSDSKIGVILGARGTGKSAFGIKFLENVYAKHKKKCYAMGFNEEEMPSWIKIIENTHELGNNAFVLIDEGGILFSSRSSMSNANKLLSDLILIARHKNLSILFISQNSSNLDINILRQADFLVLKSSSLLQREFERKIIQKIYDETNEQFKEFKDEKGLTHIYSGDFKGFISNPLPSFWGAKISKSFA